MNQKKTKTAEFIKHTAQALGFEFCGISAAVKLNSEAHKLEAWLSKGMHAGMSYMENHFDLRIDPCKLVPGAKSVITVLKNYYPQSSQQKDAPRISKYAFSNSDYHTIIRTKLNEFLFELRQQFGEINGRGFVDSAPVLERAWAQKSGLGFIGKNGNLINRKQGSFFFIATLITDIEADYDLSLIKDYCGTCTRCIDECPTDAILPGKTIDANRCISYYTIELKDQLIPPALKGQFDNWMFGCDTCQDVCPWNRFSKATSDKSFEPLPEVLNFTTSQWEELTEVEFNKIFKDSAIRRAKFSGIRRNLKFLGS